MGLVSTGDENARSQLRRQFGGMEIPPAPGDVDAPLPDDERSAWDGDDAARMD